MMSQIFISHVDTGNNNDGDTDACGWATQKWFPKSPLQKKILCNIRKISLLFQRQPFIIYFEYK